ncbi:tripartite motif-containing protein 59-like [Lytechinus variegatus]|uniref:tripartite motif-containing protein 59-like n=1 Tax=Lytechinus variegatus TaxID=7654 RepID=UPI001BB241D1|nr:tripartite motif-containing protein 59-like [Lytechinus variegatus]
MATLEHSVLQSLKCPVCFGLLNEPKQLSCTHTFCPKCIQGILACSVQRNTLSCPICKNTTNVADGDVANLKTNIPVKSLVDDVRNSKQLCDVCDKRESAARFCCECDKNMCNACLQAHDTWTPNLKHKVVMVEDIRKGRVVLKKKVYCQEEVHKSEEYECSDVCTTCKKLICMRCRMLYHEKSGHDVEDLREYNSSFKKSSELLQDQGKAKLKIVKNHMTCIDNQIKRVNDHIDGEKAKNNKIYVDAIKKIKERNITLNKQLDDQKEELAKSLNNMKIDDERLVKSIENASELLSNSLKCPLEGDVVAIHDSLSGELKNVLDRDNPKKRAATDVGDHAEKLKYTPSCDPHTLSLWELRFLKSEAKCNAVISEKGCLDCTAAREDGMMAVGYSPDRGIDIFSPDGRLQKTVIKYFKLSEVGFLSDGRYAVRGFDNKISLYTSDEEKQDVTFDTIGYSEGGSGDLTVDSNDLIYVSYRRAKKIQVFSPSGGKAIREIPCDRYEPSHITSYGDTLIVKQYRNAIIRIDMKGDIMHKLKKPWGNDLHAAVSKDNTILIASVRRNEGLLNIDEYTGELKHIRTLISDYKIERPERQWYYLLQF